MSVRFAPAARALRRAFLLAARERRCLSCSAPFVPPEEFSGAPPSAALPAAGVFCALCAVRLKRRVAGFCPHCGEPAAWPLLPPAPCGRCLVRRPPWSNLLFHGLHDGLLRLLLLRLKFASSLELAQGLGLLLAAHPGLEALGADVLAPVPLHSSRLEARGFNQALELARPLAKRLSLDSRPALLIRVRATPPQRGLSRRQRAGNLSYAFQASSAARGRHILLVDDIMTTGATLEAAAAALLDAGAAAVSVAVISRASLHFG